MTDYLAPITKENWEQAAKLEVREDQSQFVASNVWTIAESRFFPWIEMRGVMSEAVMIGFLAYGKDPAEDEYWLFRFMIDHRKQGQGHGRAALQALIRELKSTTSCTRLKVGYEPNNAVAERLYLSVGFAPSTPAPWGESTAILTI